MRPLVRVLRTALYLPLRALQALQVHPSHYFGLIDVLVRLDTPLMAYLAGKQGVANGPKT